MMMQSRDIWPYQKFLIIVLIVVLFLVGGYWIYPQLHSNVTDYERYSLIGNVDYCNQNPTDNNTCICEEQDLLSSSLNWSKNKEAYIIYNLCLNDCYTM